MFPTDPGERRSPPPRSPVLRFEATDLVGACATDLPNHSRMGDLNERAVTGCYELCVRVRLAKVPHSAIVDDVSAAVGPELDVRGPVESVDAGYERLLGRLVE